MLDLALARTVSDAALAWLTGFYSWAQEYDAEVRVVHSSAAISSLSCEAG